MLRITIGILAVLATSNSSFAHAGKPEITNQPGYNINKSIQSESSRNNKDRAIKIAQRRTVYNCQSLNGQGAQGIGWSYNGFNQACNMARNRCRQLSQGRGSCYIAHQWTKRQ